MDCSREVSESTESPGHQVPSKDVVKAGFKCEGPVTGHRNLAFLKARHLGWAQSKPIHTKVFMAATV